MFSIPQARAIVSDLYRPQPWIYWTDFLLSLLVGYSSAIVYLNAPLFSLQQILCLPVAVFALYRLSNFMHEIVHFRKGEMRAFRVSWNILAGVPMLLPSFFYESHIAHHNTNHYGTVDDGEYLPLGNGTLRNVCYFFAQVFLQPLLVITRFTLLTPISFLHPRLRQWVLEHASSFVINWRYRREIPANAPRHLWAAMDILCSIRAWCIWIWIGLGLVPWYRGVELYVLATLILSLNYVRTLAAHRYRSDGEKMSHVDQLMDSVDITGDPVFTELLCPLGLRYHALHHLFPTMPYHNLGLAHRRLMAQLPEDSAYRSLVYPSAWSVLRQMFQQIRKSSDSGRGVDAVKRWKERTATPAESESDAEGAPEPAAVSRA